MKRLLPVMLAAAASLCPLFGQKVEGYTSTIKATPILQTETTVAGQPIVYPRTKHPQVTAVLVEIPPGQSTGWHRHPFPCYGYILSGHLTVNFEGGKTVHAGPGDAFVEAVNLLHCGKNTGKQTVKLVMFVSGEVGKPYVIKKAP